MPGFPAGTFIDELDSPVVNSRGDVMGWGDIRSSPMPYGDTCYWRFHDGQLGIMAFAGQQAPSLPNGVVFDTVPDDGWPLVTGDSGDAVFLLNLRGPGIDSTNRASIWRFRGDSLHLIARQGAQAPGFPADVTFEALNSPVMNDRGQIAFSAMLSGFGPVGIWAEDLGGKLQLIAKNGDAIDIDPGPDAELRTISNLQLLGDDKVIRSIDQFRGQNDQPNAFNDLGQIAFKAWFREGGTGILVSNALMVPEQEGSVTPVIGIAVFLCGPRLRRRMSFYRKGIAERACIRC